MLLGILFLLVGIGVFIGFFNSHKSSDNQANAYKPQNTISSRNVIKMEWKNDCELCITIINTKGERMELKMKFDKPSSYRYLQVEM